MAEKVIFKHIPLINIVSRVDDALEAGHMHLSDQKEFVSDILPDLLRICKDPAAIVNTTFESLGSAFKLCALPYITTSMGHVRLTRDNIYNEYVDIAQGNVLRLLKEANEYGEMGVNSGIDEPPLFLRTLTVLMDAAVGPFYAHYSPVNPIRFVYSLGDLNMLLYHYGLEYRAYWKTDNVMIVRKVHWAPTKQ